MSEDGAVHVTVDSMSQDKLGSCLASVGPATHVCNVCRRAMRATALLNPIEFMPFFSLFSENCSGIQFSNSRSTSVFSQSFPIYVPKASSFFIGFVQETNHSCL